MSAKTLAACAIVAAAATGADAFATGSLPMGLKTRAAATSPVTMQMQGESVADILARAAAMANGSVRTTHAGGNKQASAAVASPPSYSAGRATGGESVSDILARAAAMAGQASSIQSSYNAPSAAPASTQTVSRSNESVADILARAAAMANGSVQTTHAGGNKQAQSAPKASYSAPAASPPIGKESVADILARAAAMANGSVQTTHAGGNKQASQPSYSAPAASAPRSGESVADILARAAAMSR